MQYYLHPCPTTRFQLERGGDFPSSLSLSPPPSLSIFLLPPSPFSSCKSCNPCQPPPPPLDHILSMYRYSPQASSAHECEGMDYLVQAAEKGLRVAMLEAAKALDMGEGLGQALREGDKSEKKFTAKRR